VEKLSKADKASGYVGKFALTEAPVSTADNLVVKIQKIQPESAAPKQMKKPFKCKVESGDTTQWDISLCTFLLLNSSHHLLPHDLLSQHKHVQNLRSMRNVEYGHAHDMRMTEEDYHRSETLVLQYVQECLPQQLSAVQTKLDEYVDGQSAQYACLGDQELLDLLRVFKEDKVLEAFTDVQEQVRTLQGQAGAFVGSPAIDEIHKKVDCVLGEITCMTQISLDLNDDMLSNLAGILKQTDDLTNLLQLTKQHEETVAESASSIAELKEQVRLQQEESRQ